MLILESPKIQQFQVPQMVEIGDKINIPCMVRKGSGPFLFEWKKNSELLKSKENILITDTNHSSLLTINPITEKSSGNYTCSVKTKHGSDSFSTYLSVKGTTSIF